jgi:hypothetical protein
MKMVTKLPWLPVVIFVLSGFSCAPAPTQSEDAPRAENRANAAAAQQTATPPAPAAGKKAESDLSDGGKPNEELRPEEPIPEGHVRVCGKVVPIDKEWFLCHDPKKPSDLAPITELTQLKSFSLDTEYNVDLSPLAKLPQLEEIGIRKGSPVSDFTPLSALKNVKIVRLEGTKISDLSPLQKMTKMKELDLRNTPVADIAPLANMRSLERLDLSETQVTDLSPLRTLRKLIVLDLDNTPVKDITVLKHLKRLKSLSLNNTNVVDITPLRGLRNLKSLLLEHTKVVDLTPLKKHINFFQLRLGGTRINSLRPLKNIWFTHLMLGGFPVDDAPVLKKILVIDTGISIESEHFTAGELRQMRAKLEDMPNPHRITVDICFDKDNESLFCVR